MAFQAGEGFVDFTARDSKMNRVLGRVESRLRRTQAVMASVSNVAKRLFLVGGAALGTAVKLAGDANEIMSKFRAVFKDQADAAEESADRIADAVGRSRFEILGFMAALQDTFVPLGFARDKSAQLSAAVTSLVLDVASLQNKVDANVLINFTSALVGNSEAVRSYGINMTQAALKQELLNMGIKGGTKTATEQQKVIARLNLLFKGSKDAIGDAVRTSGEFNNTIKRLLGSLKEATIELGTGFLPGLTRVVSRIIEVIERIKPWIAANGELIVRITTLTAKILVLLIVLPKFTGVIIGLIKAMSFLVANPLAALLIFLGALAVRFVVASQEGETWAERLGNSFQFISRGIDFLKDRWEVLFLSTKFVWNNIGTLIDLVGASAALVFVSLFEDAKQIFTVAIPAVFKFFLENWRDILTDMADATQTVLGNIGNNIVNFVKAIVEVIRGGDWDFAWTPLLEGFERVTKQFPEILDRSISGLELDLANTVIRLNKNLSKSFQEDVINKLAFPDFARTATTADAVTGPGLPDAPAFNLPDFGGGGGAGGGGGPQFVGLADAFKRIATAGGEDPQKKQVNLQQTMVNELKTQTKDGRESRDTLADIGERMRGGILR